MRSIVYADGCKLNDGGLEGGLDRWLDLDRTFEPLRTDDAVQGHAERMVLVSGDSDLVPAIRTIEQRLPQIPLAAVVPARDLRRGACHHPETTKRRSSGGKRSGRSMPTPSSTYQGRPRPADGRRRTAYAG